jgi:hypothetical protein
MPEMGTLLVVHVALRELISSVLDLYSAQSQAVNLSDATTQFAILIQIQ